MANLECMVHACMTEMWDAADPQGRFVDARNMQSPDAKVPVGLGFVFEPKVKTPRDPG